MTFRRLLTFAFVVEVFAFEPDRRGLRHEPPHGLLEQPLSGISYGVHEAVVSAKDKESCQNRLAHLRSLVALGLLEEALDVSLALEPQHRNGKHPDCHADTPHFGEGTIATCVATPDVRSEPVARSVVNSFIKLHSDAGLNSQESPEDENFLRIAYPNERSHRVRGSGSLPRVPVVGFSLDGTFVLAKSSIRCWQRENAADPSSSPHVVSSNGLRCRSGGDDVDREVADVSEAIALEAETRAGPHRVSRNSRRLKTEMGHPLIPDPKVVEAEYAKSHDGSVVREASLGDADNTYTVGTKTLLVIPIVPSEGDTTDVQTQSEPSGYNYGLVASAHGSNIRSYLEQCMSDNNDFLRDSSWQQLELSWTITPVFSVAYTGSSCGTPTPLDYWSSKSSSALDMMAFAAAESASPTSYPRANYDFNVVFIPKCTSQGYSGIGWVGVPGALQNAYLDDYDASVAHELGHNFGANHASTITDGSRGADAYATLAFIENLNTFVEYGNPHSTMGQGDFESYRVDFLIEGKAILDWVDDAEMEFVVPFDLGTGEGNCKPSCGPYYLSPTDASSKPASGATMGISIQTNTTNRYYFIEFRNSSRASTGGPAALINWADITIGLYTGSWEHSILTDCTPLTSSWDDAGCSPGMSVDLDTGDPWETKKVTVVVGDVQADGTLKVEIVSGGTDAPTLSHQPSLSMTPTPAPSVSLGPCSEVILGGSYTGTNSGIMGTYQLQGLDSNGNVYFTYSSYYLYYGGTGYYKWYISTSLGSLSIYWKSGTTYDSSWPPTSGWLVWTGTWTDPSATLKCDNSTESLEVVTVRGGSCSVSDLCFSSSNYPSDYSNSESCIFTIVAAGTLDVQAFSTEAGYDTLTVHGVEYSGTSGPDGVAVSAGDTLWWYSDSAVSKTGFSICVQLVPTLAPSVGPRGPTAPSSNSKKKSSSTMTTAVVVAGVVGIVVIALGPALAYYFYKRWRLQQQVDVVETQPSEQESGASSRVDGLQGLGIVRAGQSWIQNLRQKAQERAKNAEKRKERRTEADEKKKKKKNREHVTAGKKAAKIRSPSSNPSRKKMPAASFKHSNNRSDKRFTL